MLAKPSQTQSLILFESTERRQRIKHVIYMVKDFQSTRIADASATAADPECFLH
jgi:hypothetical protein